MSDPVRRIVGVPVAVETSVLNPADRQLDTNRDAMVDIREAGVRWGTISKHGVELETNQRFGWYNGVKDAQTSTSAATALQQVGSHTGMIATGFALRGGARTVQSLAPYLRPGPLAAAGQALAEGADMYLQHEPVTRSNLLRRAANVAYEGTTWTVATSVGVLAGTASSPVLTPVGGAIVGSVTAVTVKEGIDRVRDAIVESVYHHFGY